MAPGLWWAQRVSRYTCHILGVLRVGAHDHADTERSQHYLSHWHISLQRCSTGNEGEAVWVGGGEGVLLDAWEIVMLNHL